MKKTIYVDQIRYLDGGIAFAVKYDDGPWRNYITTAPVPDLPPNFDAPGAWCRWAHDLIETKHAREAV